MGGQSKSTSTTQYPQWLNDFGESVGPLASAAATKLPSDASAYPGQGVAGFSGDQTDAFQQLRNVVAGAPQNVYDTVSNWITGAATAPAQQISTERVVDQGGRLGSIDDYVAPAMAAAEGPVQSAIRKIQEAADAQRKRIGAGAINATSGEADDSRYGIQEGMLNRDTSLAIGETAGNLYNTAYTNAMNQRAADLARFLGVDTANAQFGETALGRAMTGANALETGAQSDQTRLLQQIQALLTSGTTQQANDQAGLNSAYQESLGEYGQPFNVLAALSGALRGMPTSSTTTTSQPDNTLYGLGGALGSAALMAMLM
jgi:hypothetical protein